MDDNRDLVVLCAANNWDDVRLSDRPLAEALSRHVPVLYVDPPLSHLTPRRHPQLAPALRAPRLRRAGTQLWRLTPVVTPLPFRRGVVSLTRLLARRHLARALEQLTTHHTAGAIVSTWLDVDVFDLLPGAAHAYWVQDDVASGAALWGLDPDRLLAAEQRVAAAADVVLVANPVLVPTWEASGLRAAPLPNGCDATRYAESAATPRPSDPSARRPVAGFVGHLNARTDLALLHAVADRGVGVVLVGPIARDLGPELDSLLARPEVTAVGPQPFEDLPRWFSGMGVGLLPYRNDAFNRTSFPLKTLEYLVAGLPVVSTALPASQWLDCPDIEMADDPDTFAELASRSAGRPRTEEDVSRRRAFAEQHSWDARARTLLEQLRQAGR